LSSNTQQVEISQIAREVGRAALALGGLAAWTLVGFLIAG
jgi:hypothetical protein